MKHTLRKYTKNFMLATTSLLTLFVISILITHLFTSPSNTRIWNDDQAVLPYADIHGTAVTVHNIRNFTYASTTSYTKNWYDKTFDLTTLRKVWYVVEPFEGVPGSAHTFLSFEFDNNQFLSVSIEIRKEQGESFNPFKGLYNQYELTYVVADEQDVIKLRTNYRKDTVYLYPVKISEAKAQELFLSIITRVNTLKDTPEFYNTVTNNCTTNIVNHINIIAPGTMNTFYLQEVFPEYSDKLAYRLGLLNTDLPFESIRDRFRINEKAMKYADDVNFSVRIRE